MYLIEELGSFLSEYQMRARKRLMRKGGTRRRHQLATAHPPTLWQRIAERLRGREQLLVKPGEGFPLLLITYPRGEERVAREVETAFSNRLPQLPDRLRAPYASTFAALPVMVVVLLRPLNACGCLGHFHPTGAESQLARRLSSDLGEYVAEVDLAYEEIRKWQPRPLSSLATGDLGARLGELHFQTALLSVLLHELQHVAFPDQQEAGIRGASDELYLELMEETVQLESGHGYGLTPPRTVAAAVPKREEGS